MQCSCTQVVCNSGASYLNLVESFELQLLEKEKCIHLLHKYLWLTWDLCHTERMKELWYQDWRKISPADTRVLQCCIFTQTWDKESLRDKEKTKQATITNKKIRNKKNLYNLFFNCILISLYILQTEVSFDERHLVSLFCCTVHVRQVRAGAEYKTRCCSGFSNN